MADSITLGNQNSPLDLMFPVGPYRTHMLIETGSGLALPHRLQKYFLLLKGLLDLKYFDIIWDSLTFYQAEFSFIFSFFHMSLLLSLNGRLDY